MGKKKAEEGQRSSSTVDLTKFEIKTAQTVAMNEYHEQSMNSVLKTAFFQRNVKFLDFSLGWMNFFDEKLAILSFKPYFQI